MNKRKLNIVGTEVGELTDTIGKVVENVLQDREDKQVKKEQINKALKRDTMVSEKKKTVKNETSDSHSETHSCPTCKANLKDTGKNFEVCEGCGDTVVTFKKDQKMLICSSCGNVVSSSDAQCPNCGSKKAHWSI